MSENVYFAVRSPRRGDQWQTIGNQRRLTKALLFGVFGDEVATLCHLLDQKRDGLHVRLDGLQRFGIMNERVDVAHRAR